MGTIYEIISTKGFNVFPFNWDPQRVGTKKLQILRSINTIFVSIQLGSPASGDGVCDIRGLTQQGRFHSIGIPSEWGL